MATSLTSAQRTHSVSFAFQRASTSPPRPAARPAALPSTAAAVALFTDELQSNRPPGATQVLTAEKRLPNPYSNTMVCAEVLPPLRHCSPLNARLKPDRSWPLSFLNSTAIHPPTAPLAGEPKYVPPEPTPPSARSVLAVAPKL